MKIKAISLPKRSKKAIGQRRPSKKAAMLVGMVTGSAAVMAAGIGVGYAVTHRTKMLDRVRTLNKRFYNRFTLQFAGYKHSPYAVIHHYGRKTGHTYRTPVVAEPTTSGFLIPLPYGQMTDWCQNILGAGTARLDYQGQAYQLDNFAIVNFAVAEKSLIRPSSGVWHLFHIEAFLQAQASLVTEGQKHTHDHQQAQLAVPTPLSGVPSEHY